MKQILVYGMTNNPGGIESYLMNILKNLASTELRFDFVTDFPEIAYEKELHNAGSNVYFITRKGESLIRHWKDLYKILINHPEYRCVYFNILDAGAVFTMFIPWLLRRRIVAHSHNGQTDKIKLQKICRPILKMMVKDKVACSIEAAKYMFGEKMVEAGKVLIVPNAINIKKYKFNPEIRENTRKSMHLENKTVICHVGRLSEQKNPFRLLDIFKEVLKINNDAILLSVGSGEIEDEIHRYAEKIEVKNQVMFLGVRDDVEKLLQAADVFVLPSKYEGLPIVALEAQASGIPCVLSSVISHEVDVSKKIKFLDLDDTNQEWAAEILKYANHKRYDCMENMREQGYDSDFMSKRTEQLIQILEKN